INSFDSDVDNNINKDNCEARRRKEKNKPPKIAYYYNETRNTYLKEETVKPNPSRSLQNRKFGAQTTFLAPAIS
ncbi:10084_t:CDS:2, partial [Racocetra persica]